MKIVLRIFAFILCLSFIFSFASCKDSSASRIIEASGKMKSLESAEAVIKNTVSGNVLGEKFDVSTESNFKSLKKADGNTDIYLSTQSASGGFAQGLKSEVYIVDGYIYLSSLGLKIKTKATEEEISYIGVDPEEASFPIVFNEEMLADAEIIKDEKDLKINVTVKSDVMNDYITKQLENLLETLPSENSSVKTSDIDMSFTVNEDNYVEYLKMTYALTASYEDQAAELNCITEITYKNPGTPVTVPLPDNANEYIDYSDFE